MREIEIRGQTYEVHTLQGRVVDQGKRFETIVTGGGTINHDPTTSVESRTVVHDQIFVVDRNGREHVLKLVGWDFDCREGHLVTATWLIRKGRDAGPYVLIQNDSTGDVKVHEGELAKVCSPSALIIGLCASAMLCISFVFKTSQATATAAWYSFWIILIGGFLYRYVIGRRRMKELIASDQLLPR